MLVNLTQCPQLTHKAWGETLLGKNYIHNNPCSKKWNLCNNPIDYPHSSAKFYLSGEQGIYAVTNVLEMEDVVFVKKSGVS